MKGLHMVAYILLIVGGLNWGLVALGYNVVEKIFGMGAITTIIYALVGLAAVLEAVTHRKSCKACAGEM